MDGSRIEIGDWRGCVANFYNAPHLKRCPSAGLDVLDTCVPLEWAVYRPTVTHAALFLAYVAYPKEGKGLPARAMTDVLAQLGSRDHKAGEQGWIFQ